MSAVQSLDLLPISQHAHAWNNGLRRIGLSPTGDSGSGILVSACGGRLARLACGRQPLVSRVPDGGGVWLVVPLDGTVTLDGRVIEEIAFGPANGHAELRCDSLARLFFARFRSPVERDSLQQGVARLLTVFLRGVADTLEQLEPADLAPIENAVLGFLNAAATSPVAGVPRGAPVSFLRIVRLIEPRLGNPALSLTGIAREQGVSERYLRRLFEVSGARFGDYVRVRRLERCKAELDDPGLAREPVATIGFRWGFNDPAHFSRAFRDQFGLPPRAYRESVRHARATAARLRRGCTVSSH